MAEQTREWVGLAPFGGGRLCMLLTIGGDGRVVLDLPGVLCFRLPLAAEEGDGLRFRVPPGPGPTLLNLTEAQGGLSGTVTFDDETAVVPFEPLLPFDRAAFAPSIGPYHFDDGRDVLLCMRGDGAETIPFLADGDRVSRLYPVGTSRFISDDGERIELQPGQLIDKSLRVEYPR